MARYIPLDTVVAEINKRITDAPINNIGHQRVWAYNDVKDILDTLEVKGVDLEKEIEQSFIDLDYHLDAYNRVEDYVGENIDMVEYKRIAKHFFELALSLKNN